MPEWFKKYLQELPESMAKELSNWFYKEGDDSSEDIQDILFHEEWKSK